MNLSNKIILGITFIILGGLTYLNGTVNIGLNTGEIFGCVFIIYGVLSVYHSIEAGKRNVLTFASAVFITGIVLFVKFRFELADERGLAFTSILFGSGSVFFILFIENVKEKFFLITSLTLLLLGFLSTNIFKGYGLLTTANKIAGAVEIFWPVILILFGVIIFVQRKK